MNEDPIHDELDRLRAENARLAWLYEENRRLRKLCRDMLPVFEAARPLVLNLERLRDAAKGAA